MAALSFDAPTYAQSALGGSSGQASASPFASADGGAQIVDVGAEVQGTTGEPAKDARIREEALRAAGIEAGGPVDAGTLLLALQRIRTIEGVDDASYVLRADPMGTALIFRLTLLDERHTASERSAVRLPKLYESSRSMLKLVLNGGMGFYSEGNPFFLNWTAFNRGSPVAPGPPTSGRTNFVDTFFEPGIAGITQIGNDKLWAYGSATMLSSGTSGQDIYRRNDSVHSDVEKAYVGLLWAPEKDQTLNTSLGRQNFTLNDGFLIHQVKGSTNVGERRALYLGARTAFDRTTLISARYGRWGLKAFNLDPNEYEPLESNSKFAGTNVRYDFGDGLIADGTYISNVHSDSTFPTPQGTKVPREGIRTTAGHLRWRNAFHIRGLSLESELAHQGSSRADVSASAGYASAGYRFLDTTWKPAFVVRYAQWSGDRPGTTRYERWDPLLPAGSDEWAGGITFSKYVANSNLQQLRLRFFAEPAPNFNFTIDWFKYQALETNNLGATRVLSTLSSRNLGDELMFIGRWFIGKNYYVQTLASINWPGEAIKSALPGSSKQWTSLQASLYWFF